MIEIAVAPHPLLEAAAFVTRFPSELGANPVPDEVARLLAGSLPAESPFVVDDAARAAVRDLLRHGGYKPTGRGKPSSEYLARAIGEATLRSINLAVDVGNAVSLHSGLPISVVDVERTRAPLSIALAPDGTSYVFNASGQAIDVAGLLCLFDADGACANAVKDAQRTKTAPSTRTTLTVVWGTRALPGRAEEAARSCRGLLARAGAVTEDVTLRR